MKQISDYILYIIVAAAALFVGSCHHDDGEPFLPGRTGYPVDRTVIFYMASENSLSSSFRGSDGKQTSFSRQDTLEISTALRFLPMDARVVVFMDDLTSSSIYAGDLFTPLQRVMTYPYNVQSTDSTGMLCVLGDITRLFPSNHYGLVMWSHASGWLFPHEDEETPAYAPKRSFGIDNGRRSTINTGPQMNIPTLAHVLAQLPHFDFIFFDACFMQCIEAAYELRRVTDYVAGSPAEIPGSGAPYELITPLLCASPANLEGAVNAYADYYTTNLTYAGAELSLIRTAALDSLAEATRPLVQQLFGEHLVPNCNDVQYYTHYSRWNTFTECYDMQSLIYHNVSAEAYDSWLEAFQRAVPLSRLSPRWTTNASTYPMTLKDPDHSGGVSVFVLNSRNEQMGWVEDYRQMEWYKAVGMDQTGW